jgi:phage tail P2-like protein
MSDLLPANATAQERAVSLAIERSGAVPPVVREVWNPDTCPANLLAWLAWAFSVDEWDPAWTDAQKRGAIKSSIEVHRYKGTIGAVRSALEGLFYDVQVQEWFNQLPAGAPYTFRILLEVNQVGAPQAAFASLLNLLERTKNLRSHLDDIELIVKTPAGPKLVAASGVGSEIVLTYEPPRLVCNETTICI